jgi:hypothetical protein
MGSVLGQAGPDVAANLSPSVRRPRATRSSRPAANEKITHILSDSESESEGFQTADEGVKPRDEAFWESERRRGRRGPDRDGGAGVA